MQQQLDFDSCIFIDGCKLSKADVKVIEKPRKKTKNEFYELDTFVCLGADGIIGCSQDSFLSTRQKKIPDFEKIGKAKGTRVDHYQQFATEVIQLLREHQRHNCAIVLGNFPSCNDQKVVKAFVKAGHLPILLPQKSSFLSPTVHFWAKVHAGVKRTTVTADDNIAARIKDVVLSIDANECQNWIEQSKILLTSPLP